MARIPLMREKEQVSGKKHAVQWKGLDFSLLLRTILFTEAPLSGLFPLNLPQGLKEIT
jgi:hypothetical protein